MRAYSSHESAKITPLSFGDSNPTSSLSAAAIVLSQDATKNPVDAFIYNNNNISYNIYAFGQIDGISKNPLGASYNFVHTTHEAIGVSSNFVHTTQRAIGASYNFVYTTQRAIGATYNFVHTIHRVIGVSYIIVHTTQRAIYAFYNFVHTTQLAIGVSYNFVHTTHGIIIQSNAFENVNNLFLTHYKIFEIII